MNLDGLRSNPQMIISHHANRSSSFHNHIRVLVVGAEQNHLKLISKFIFKKTNCSIHLGLTSLEFGQFFIDICHVCRVDYRLEYYLESEQE